ncbi:hypothetical protein IQ03_02435 [Gemmobacter caeni]|uniref:Uncharacterized protein n=1 Tax=Gemmobacter caeni TaxID=589035 RepID=A0A2T6AZ56_9RHOB|nr:hypothetical protein [Gemmobacter caeni]PTX49090.1 hypothetical protein C8N34_108200 [Gemmobacter caeni]TWI98909.1 hypothetical protein IQ03_02435 [Gemmobacter caeni]
MGNEHKAVALKIAERMLIKTGWKFSTADVGLWAKQILDAMDVKMERKPHDHNE